MLDVMIRLRCSIDLFIHCRRTLSANGKNLILPLLLLLSFDASGERQEQFRNKYWHEDIEQIRQKLPKYHKDLFRNLPQYKFQSELSAIEEAIPKLRDSEIIVAIMRLIASVGDPHTEVDSDTTGFHNYPLELLWFPDGLHVIRTVKAQKHLLGCRLVQVGDLPVAMVLQRIVPVFPHPNLPWVQTLIPEYLTKAEILSAQKIVANEKSARFVFEDSSGKKLSALLYPQRNDKRSQWISLPAKALRYKHPGIYYWFEYLKDSKTLYFNYNRCAEMKRQPFSKFNSEMFRFVDSHPVERFVVDLRNNSGGNSEVIAPFVEEISKRPLINKKGHLFVVIGRATYSSGVMAAYWLKDTTKLLFVGGPTGGKPNFFGEVKDFKLTHSHVGIQFSTEYFRLSDRDEMLSLFPDIQVQLSWNDYLAGQDPAINAILQYK